MKRLKAIFNAKVKIAIGAMLLVGVVKCLGEQRHSHITMCAVNLFAVQRWHRRVCIGQCGAGAGVGDVVHG